MKNHGDKNVEIKVFHYSLFLFLLCATPLLLFILALGIGYAIISSPDIYEVLKGIFAPWIIIGMFVPLYIIMLRNRLSFSDNLIYCDSSFSKKIPGVALPYSRIKKVILKGKRINIIPDTWWYGSWHFYIRDDIKKLDECVNMYENWKKMDKIEKECEKDNDLAKF